MNSIAETIMNSLKLFIHCTCVFRYLLDIIVHIMCIFWGREISYCVNIDLYICICTSVHDYIPIFECAKYISCVCFCKSELCIVWHKDKGIEH